MDAAMYEILSLFARYFFAGLMVVIVFRAWRITVKDNRRANVLRAWSPQTGCIGQLVVRVDRRSPDLVPILREGILGSSSKADMQIRSKDVLPEHAHVESREGGLLLRPIGRAQVAIGKDDITGDRLFVRDGDTLSIGKLKALVVLFDPEPSARIKAVPPAPQPKPSPKKPKSGRLIGKRQAKPQQPIDFFDEDKLWPKETKKSTRRS